MRKFNSWIPNEWTYPTQLLDDLIRSNSLTSKLEDGFPGAKLDSTKEWVVHLKLYFYIPAAPDILPVHNNGNIEYLLSWIKVLKFEIIYKIVSLLTRLSILEQACQPLCPIPSLFEMLRSVAAS